MKRVPLFAAILCTVVIIWIILASRRSSPEQAGQTDPQARRVDGIVTDSDGLPVSKAILNVMFGGHGSCISDKNGRFRLSWFTRPVQTDGQVYLLVRHAKQNLAAVVALEPEMTKLDIKIEPAVSFTGMVADETGKALRGAKANVTFWNGKYGTMLSETNVKTNRKGRFDIAMIPYGHKCTIVTEADGYGRETIDVFSDDAVDGRLDVGIVKLKLADKKVAGVVYDANDIPVQNAEISAYGDGQPMRRGMTDSQGRFVVEGMCEGTIQIYAHARDRSPIEYGHTAAEAGATDVLIVLKKSSSSSLHPPEQAPSLMGKSLPELNSIEVDYNFDRANEQMILACFFDMGQRPSRNCISRLVERAGQLRQSGISVIAVQASKVDTNSLNEWMAENNVSFTIGTIQDNEEQVRFNWGVKSLPWLILTDKKHIVIAEGFAVYELDEKIVH
jgi:hypothetical protein